MPIPQELFFLWDGHLARPIYFCKRSIEEIEEIEESDLTDKPGGLAMSIRSFFLPSRMNQSI